MYIFFQLHTIRLEVLTL